jgi:hypothetical protein
MCAIMVGPTPGKINKERVGNALGGIGAMHIKGEYTQYVY